MFFKRLLSMGAKKETLVYTADAYRLYDTTHSGSAATKMVLNHSVAPYEFLRRVRHENLIKPLKIDTGKKFLVTERLFPFRQLCKREAVEFNKYSLYKIAMAVEFLHGQCEVAHGNITLDSLFMDGDGRIVLGGFERSRRSTAFDEDCVMMSNLVNELVGISTSVHEFIRNRGFCTELFFDLEIAFFGYRSFSIEQKLSLISTLEANENEIIDLYRRRVALMVYDDLNRDVPKEFKLVVVQFMVASGPEDFDAFLVPLFSVLDSGVRLYLLRNSGRYSDRISTLDPVVESLSLGLKCREMEIKKETISFITRSLGLISNKALLQIVEVMYGYIIDDAGVALVLRFLTSVKPSFKNSDVVYRIVCKYLLQSSCKLEALNAMGELYPAMDTYKLGTELMPLLCSYLPDTRLQPAVFALLENVLGHLKEHRTEIVSKEWKLRGLSGFFSPKADEKHSVVDAQHKEADGESDGWDDEW
jgi:hypothetical protein